MLNIIKTEREYDAALERIHTLMHMDLEDNSPESDELEELALLIENYENIHYPIASPNCVDATLFRTEQNK